MINLGEVIKTIDVNASFEIINNNIDTIIWYSTPIPKADIEAKMVEVQAEYDAEEWKRNRQIEYPSIDDCIHALLDGGDTLTELQAKRTATKTKYPKSGT